MRCQTLITAADGQTSSQCTAEATGKVPVFAGSQDVFAVCCEHGARFKAAAVLHAQAVAMRQKARDMRHGYPVTAERFKAAAADLEAQAAREAR